MNKWLVQHINMFDNTIDSRIIETTKHVQGAVAIFMGVKEDEYAAFNSCYRMVSNGIGSVGFHCFVEGEVITATLI